MSTEKHHTEDALDRLARTASKDDHVDICPVCAARYAFFVRLHEATRGEMSRSRDPRIVALAGGNVIELRPATKPPDLSAFGVTGGVVVLAAQSASPAEGVHHAVSTFVGEKEHIVIRVVRERSADTCRMFVLTPDPAHAANKAVTIRMPDGTTLTTVTDESGTAVIHAAPDLAWETAVLAIESR
jgi:hypothetical protein